jgi:hypothetical protein
VLGGSRPNAAEVHEFDQHDGVPASVRLRSADRLPPVTPSGGPEGVDNVGHAEQVNIRRTGRNVEGKETPAPVERYRHPNLAGSSNSGRRRRGVFLRIPNTVGSLARQGTADRHQD